MTTSPGTGPAHPLRHGGPRLAEWAQRAPFFHFGIEYTAASVPPLLEIALDERSGTWSRRQARALLLKLPEPPALELSPATGGDLAASAADYLRAFPELARTPAFAAFFESSRLPR